MMEVHLCKLHALIQIRVSVEVLISLLEAVQPPTGSHTEGLVTPIVRY